MSSERLAATPRRTRFTQSPYWRLRPIDAQFASHNSRYVNRFVVEDVSHQPERDVALATASEPPTPRPPRTGQQFVRRTACNCNLVISPSAATREPSACPWHSCLDPRSPRSSRVTAPQPSPSLLIHCVTSPLASFRWIRDKPVGVAMNTIWWETPPTGQV